MKKTEIEVTQIVEDEEEEEVEEERKKLILDLAKEINSNCSQTKINVPNVFNIESKSLVFRIVLARVGFALQNYVYLGLKKMILTKYCDNIAEIENTRIEDELLSFKIARLLNLSRTLIDSEKAATNSFFYFTPIKIYNLAASEKKHLESAKSLFNEIVKSKHFRNSVAKTCELLGYQNNESEKMLEIFLNCPKKIKFVENPIFGGMVGFNQIYLSNACFFLTDKDSIIARIIGLMFHEGFHETQREFFDDFALLTPRSKDEIEGGLLFEQTLWGTYDITYWDIAHCRNVIDLKRWDGNSEIFSQEELQKRVVRGILNPRCSGLCIEHLHIGDF